MASYNDPVHDVKAPVIGVETRSACNLGGGNYLGL